MKRRWLFLAVVGVFALWAGTWFFMSKKFPGVDPQAYAARGQFGDMFGALTCLFTGLGLVGLIYNAWMQRKQLEHQQWEIENQRREMQEEKAFRAKQQEVLEAQLRKVQLEAAPIFEWRSIERNGNIVSFEFVNKGGEFLITDIEQTNAECLERTDSWILPGKKGIFTFSCTEKQPIRFVIRYQERNGKKDWAKFLQGGIAGLPEELPKNPL